MAKMKTKRGAAKRFSFTGSGIVKRRKANLRHILANKNRKRKHRLGKNTTIPFYFLLLPL